MGVAKRPMERGLGWTTAEIEIFLVEVRKSLMDSSFHSYMYVCLFVLEGDLILKCEKLTSFTGRYICYTARSLLKQGKKRTSQLWTHETGTFPTNLFPEYEIRVGLWW